MNEMDYTPSELIHQLEDKLRHSLKVVKHYTGETFIKEGNNTPVYIIKSGTCRVFLKNKHGGEVVLGAFGPGNTLGDMSKLNKTMASANVSAQTDIELYELNDDEFDLLWQISPEVSKQLYTKMCQRLTTTNEHLAKNVNDLIQLRGELQVQVDEQVKDIKDINASLQQKNDEMAQLMSTRDNFLNMAIHDLRSPLSVIKGYLELLHPENLDSMAFDHVKGILEKNTVNMLSLVNDLLGISKLNSIQLRLDLEEIDLTPVIIDEILGQAIIAKQKDIIIHSDLPDHLPKIKIDTRRFSEILQNLLSNAIKFTERGKQVFVHTRHDQDNLYIEVRDEGQGIPKEDLPKLFKSFEPISTKATEGELSTGLGLSIVKKLVELHDGIVSVQSEVGQGTTFTVSLPLLKP